VPGPPAGALEVLRDRGKGMAHQSAGAQGAGEGAQDETFVVERALDRAGCVGERLRVGGLGGSSLLPVWGGGWVRA
jgi:hypothetical protein